MERFVTQIPWIVVWAVVLVLQERFLRKKNWFGSLFLLWLTLLLSVFWDWLVYIFAPETGTRYLYGGHFWILFLIAAVIYVMSKRRERKEREKSQASVQEKRPASEMQERFLPETKENEKDEEP